MFALAIKIFYSKYTTKCSHSFSKENLCKQSILKFKTHNINLKKTAENKEIKILMTSEIIVLVHADINN